MEEHINLIIAGANAIALVVVFIIQRTHINSMKSFMSIFDLNKVNEFVEMSDKTAKMKALDFIKDELKQKGVFDEIAHKTIKEAKSLLEPQLIEEQHELVGFVINVLEHYPHEERVSLAKQFLPKTSRYFNKIIKEMKDFEDNNNSSQQDSEAG